MVPWRYLSKDYFLKRASPLSPSSLAPKGFALSTETHGLNRTKLLKTTQQQRMFLRDNPQFLESIDDYMLKNSTIKETIGEDTLDQMGLKTTIPSPRRVAHHKTDVQPPVKFNSTFKKTGLKHMKTEEETHEPPVAKAYQLPMQPTSAPVGIVQAIKKYQTQLERNGGGVGLSPSKLTSNAPAYLDTAMPPVRSPQKAIDRKGAKSVV